MGELIKANGIQFHVTDEGTGSPLVFVHGYPLNSTIWDAQIDAFAKSHRVIVPDLRGFGQSEVTEGETTMEQFADDIAALLDAMAITEPIALCGLSMGGYIAMAFWSRYTNHLWRLVLSDTRAVGDTPEAATARRAMADRVLSEGPTPQVEGMMGKLFAAQTETDQPAIVEKVKAMMMGTDPKGMYAALHGMAKRRDWTSTLSEITTPTLVICGTDDRISPLDEMRSIADAMPNATFVEVHDAGHMAPMENPSAYNTALANFLAK